MKKFCKRTKEVFIIFVILTLVVAVLFDVNISKKVKAYTPQQAAYFVSLTGSDSNPGTESQPFRTIETARDIVRTINSNMTQDIIVMIRGGDYYISNTIIFNENDSGTNGYKVIYTNYPGENVRIIGGEKLNGANWQLYSGNIYRYYKSGVDVNQLFENGIASTMARNPDESYLYPESDGDYYSFTYKSGDVSTTADYSNAQLFYYPSHVGYLSEIQPIDSINHTTRRISVPEETRWSLDTGTKYYIQNVLEFLDAPGEFYIDKTNGYIYYWPKNTPIGNQEIIIPTVDKIIEIKGSSESNLAQYIQFEGPGLMFEISKFTDNFQNELQYIEPVSNHKGIFYLENTENITLKYLKIKNAGFNGVFMKRYNQYNTVYGCEITYPGKSGVYLHGYELDYPEGTTREEKLNAMQQDLWYAQGPDVNNHNTIKNNYFAYVGRNSAEASGVFLYQSSYNEISNNFVEYSPRWGINGGGAGGSSFTERYLKNNTIKRNEVRHVDMASCDTGVIYIFAGGYYNLVENNKITYEPYHWSDVRFLFGYYIDNETERTTVKDNVEINWPDNGGSYRKCYFQTDIVDKTETGNSWQGASPDTSNIGLLSDYPFDRPEPDPVPAPGIIIDNGETGYTETSGTWYDTGLKGYNYSSVRYADTSGASCEWRPNLPTAGDYEVFVMFPAHTANDNDAKYTVYYNGGSDVIYVDQEDKGLVWISLGIYNFSSGTSGFVKLEADETSSQEVVRADAVKFVYAPGTVIDNGGTGYNETSGTWYDSGLTSYHGSSTRYACASGATCEWRPNIGTSGKYDVYVTYPAHTASDNDAKFTVHYNGGSKVVVVNQEVNGLKWKYIGTYDFTSGTSGYVELEADETNTQEAVRADAVRFAPSLGIILDNEGVEYNETSGTWYKSGLTGYNGSATRYADTTGASCEWRPNIPETGAYEVFVMYPAHTASDNDAKYTVYYNGGSSIVYVNQETNGLTWVSLGTYYFAAGTSGYVKLEADETSSQEVVRADVVRFYMN